MITASRWQSCNIRRPDSRTHCGVSLLEMVRGTGLEPARPCGHWLLRPARLPIPPAPRVESGDSKFSHTKRKRLSALGSRLWEFAHDPKIVLEMREPRA